MKRAKIGIMILIVCFSLMLGELRTLHALIVYPNNPDPQNMSIGTLFATFNPDGSLLGSTVDHWRFSITHRSDIEIKAFTLEHDSHRYAGDVNLDGHISFFDPEMFLYNDDGSLDSGDLLINVDSYLLAGTLLPGNYLLSIGANDLTEEEARTQTNDSFDNFMRTRIGEDLLAEDYLAYDRVDYEIVWTDNIHITNTPEPATVALLGIGLFGLACEGVRRRWKNKAVDKS